MDKQYVTQTSGGWMLQIPVDNTCEGMQVNEIAQFVSYDTNRAYNERYCDLAVWWDDNGKLHTVEEADAVIDAFDKGAYTEQLKQHLLAAGFSKQAVDAVRVARGEGTRASYVAFDIAQEVRKAMCS